MGPLQNAFITVLITVIAWVAIEAFVNNAHRIKGRFLYILAHNTAVIVVFALLFAPTFHFIENLAPLRATALAMCTVFLLEFLVFRYLYSGERWFLNYVDWILPISLAAMTVYGTGIIVG